MNKFQVYYEDFGRRIDIRHLDIEKDIPTIHEWVNQDYAFFWGLQGSSVEEVTEEYIKLTSRDQYDVLVGEIGGTPVFLLEKYSPFSDVIGEYYQAQPGDIGVHMIVSPAPEPKIENFTWYVFSAVIDFVFKDRSNSRILVEPDIRNRKMFALCERLGFTLDNVVELPHKTAQLAFLTRRRFRQFGVLQQVRKRSAMNSLDNVISAQEAVCHLSPEVWREANRQLIKKAIAEFSHERLFQPVLESEQAAGWGRYVLSADLGHVHYAFSARRLALNHYWVEATSIVKFVDGAEATLDAVTFFKDFKETLGIEPNLLPLYMEEILSTLQGSAFKMTKGNPEVHTLVHADFQTIEQSMTEGHPGFVANNGRIGFDSSDYRAYAPEVGNSFPVLWLAGHKDHTKYAGIETLAYETLLAQELKEETQKSFSQVIVNRDCDPNDYLFIPVHPWQWFNKLVHVYSSEIATNRLICLGYGPDQYLAQQSIRTLFNISNPQKFYVKTALSILNMGFMRGLPYYYLGTAPKMAAWLEDLLYKDVLIQETGFRMLSEVASVSYENAYFEELGPHNDYNKMLASLWRESPMAAVQENQTPMTMAAFLHVDHKGKALLPEIIASSKLSIDDWLRKYLTAYLTPLVHCFYEYDLVFMPHGENVVMVLENGVPVRAFIKDITEEACILSSEVELPKYLSRMYAEVEDDLKLLSIFIDIFDGFFRFMSQILVEHAGYEEERFWQMVAENILEYQHRYAHHREKFARYDLFAKEFQHSCLNRLQLRNNKTMIDLNDPAALLQFAGKLENPIATYRV